MNNILFNFFKNQNKCSHKNALINSKEGYCPDCGQYLVKNYYLVRCSCCDIKREAKILFDEIVPTGKFCTNCGSKEYYIEKIDNINFIDAQYAIYLKEEISNIKLLHAQTQIWSENAQKIMFLPQNFT